MKKKLLFLMAVCATMQLQAHEKLIVVNEGMWQTDNGRLTYFCDGEIVSNQWFRDINGKKLGDTPNDIIQVNDQLIAIAMNWSNIVEFITPDGREAGATEDVPNNRKLATDGKYVYVTSYAHEVGVAGTTRQFTKGYVAKIDITDFKVKDAVEVGYEPEGIAYYKGYLFVANSGGYAFQEDHEYESTVSVIDTRKMEVVRTVDTGQINLYGKVSQSGQYLCINSPGDYYEVNAATIILDCEAVLNNAEDEQCCKILDYSATSNCTDREGRFFAIGSHYSYLTGEYEFNYVTIDPAEVFDSDGESGVEENLPGTIKDDISTMTMPYGIYVNPYTGYIYATDSGEFTGAGALYQWTPAGEFIGKYKTYINPAHFLALKPNDSTNSAGQLNNDEDKRDVGIINLQGLKVTKPQRGQTYIKNGKKFIHF